MSDFDQIRDFLNRNRHFTRARKFILEAWEFVSVRGWMFYLIIGILTVISTTILIRDNKSELAPTLWISAVAACFSYQTYFYAKEKFRIDLFDKRWEIYQKALEFCGVVMSHATLIPTERTHDDIMRGMQAAQECFRGVGHHKTSAFFGKDILDVFDDLNKSYAWLSAGFTYADEGYAANRQAHVMRIVNIANNLPELFRPYIYFGDYKRNLLVN